MGIGQIPKQINFEKEVLCIYPKLPTIIKAFVTDAMLEKWVEEALAAAKTAWEKNAKIAEYIEKPANEKADTAPEE